MIKNISDIKIGDNVFGTDNKWHKVIGLTNINIPNRMFEMQFSNGNVICSDNHIWTLIINKNKKDLETLNIFENKDIYTKLEYKFGREDGPILLNIIELEPKQCKCLIVDNNDKQFLILTDKNKEIFTHNCGFRMVCGRLGGVASLMALGNSMATSIDGKHPGAGMISSQGVIDNIQYYYEEHAWLENFFKVRGLNNLGYLTTEEGMKEEQILESLEGDEEITSSSETINIDFSGVHGEVDKKKDQNFTEV